MMSRKNLTFVGVMAIVLLLLVSASARIASAQLFSFKQSFDDPTPTSGDQFGWSVAINGNNLVIGSRNDDTLGTNVGQAFIFDSLTSSLLHTLNDPSPTTGDRFGRSVSVDGNFALVSDSADDSNGNDVGKAHLFDVTSGNLLRTFDDPTITNKDQFSWDVALDGNNVLIGAHRDDTLGTDVGQAHLFDANTGNLLRTFDDPSPTNVDNFGRSVAIDGNYALVGAIGDDTTGTDVGQAHLFDINTGNLLQTFNDPTVTTSDQFGTSVAISGNLALIGAPFDDTNGSDVGQAHLFDISTGNLLKTFNDPTATTGDQFGISVDIEGDYALIGAYLDDTIGTDVGQTHLFEISTGDLLQTFNEPALIGGDRSGHSAALNGDSLVIGAWAGQGQAHLFQVSPPLVDSDPGTYSVAQIFDDPSVGGTENFGFSLAFDGNRVLVGASGDSTNGSSVGQAHLFDTAGNLLLTFDDPTITSEDQFGYSVAMDGNLVLISAVGDDTIGTQVGQAHLFDATTGNLLFTLDDPTPTSGDLFGFSVALDGNYALIGARSDDTSGNNVGQAHLFDTSTGNLLRTFDDPTITGGDLFGYSVALDGNHVLIGARNDDSTGNNAGQAYLFDAASGNLLQTFNDPTTTGSDLFGWSVDIDGNYLVIGAIGDDTQAADVGQVYLFDTTTGDLLRTFNDPFVSPDDTQFGRFVDIDGSLLLVGAPFDNAQGTDVGQAFLFDIFTGELLEVFDDPTLTSSDGFGWNGAIAGDDVLLSARFHEIAGNDVGQLHLFSLSGNIVPEPSTIIMAFLALSFGLPRARFLTASV